MCWFSHFWVFCVILRKFSHPKTSLDLLMKIYMKYVMGGLEYVRWAHVCFEPCNFFLSADGLSVVGNEGDTYVDSGRRLFLVKFMFFIPLVCTYSIWKEWRGEECGDLLTLSPSERCPGSSVIKGGRSTSHGTYGRDHGKSLWYLPTFANSHRLIEVI